MVLTLLGIWRRRSPGSARPLFFSLYILPYQLSQLSQLLILLWVEAGRVLGGQGDFPCRQ